MKIETTKHTKQQKEITLPYYTQTNCHQSKVISESECIQVCSLDGWQGISMCSPSIAFSEGHKKSNESKFQKAFAKISEILNEKIK